MVGNATSSDNFDQRFSARPVDSGSIKTPRLQLALLKPASIRKRLTLGVIALMVLVATFVAGNFAIAPDKGVHRQMLGGDFLAFYTAGALVRHGQTNLLYDLPAVREIESAISGQNKLETGKGFGPYWNPPFYALYLAQFARLPYPQALNVWTLVNLTCLAGAIILLARMLPALVIQPAETLGVEMALPQYRRERRNGWLIAALVLTSMPFIQAISHGQNTFFSLLLLCATVTAWRNKRAALAGALCGLLLYKPQLAAVVACMLVLSLGARVCLGLAFVAGGLTVLTGLLLPDTLDNFLTQLPKNLHYMQVENAYLWERHVTLKAFWRLLLQGQQPGEAHVLVTALTVASLALVGGLLLNAWRKTRSFGTDDVWTGQTSHLSRDRLISATIISMPLLMPFYFDYDLLLLSIPATLFAGEILAKPADLRLDRAQRLMLGTWIALYFWLMLNPPLAKLSHVNLSVMLLSVLSGASIFRAGRPGVRVVDLPELTATPINVRRAA